MERRVQFWILSRGQGHPMSPGSRAIKCRSGCRASAGARWYSFFKEEGSHTSEKLDRCCRTCIVRAYCATCRDRSEFCRQNDGRRRRALRAAPDNAIGTAAVNFCAGFAEGAIAVELQNMVRLRG